MEEEGRGGRRGVELVYVVFTATLEPIEGERGLVRSWRWRRSRWVGDSARVGEGRIDGGAHRWSMVRGEAGRGEGGGELMGGGEVI